MAAAADLVVPTLASEYSPDAIPARWSLRCRRLLGASKAADWAARLAEKLEKPRDLVFPPANRGHLSILINSSL